MPADDRDLVLERIRAALRNRVVQSPQKSPAAARSLPLLSARCWLPAVPTDRDGMIAMLAENCRELRADLALVGSEADAAERLERLRDAEGWSRVATHGNGWIRHAATLPGCELVNTDRRIEINCLERCDAAVTGCDALIAQTGTVLLTSATAGGRAASVLAPHHVVLCHTNQIVPDLPTALEQLEARYSTGLPSLACLITGPSRTADIEKTIVYGAHGPRRLTIICVDRLTGD